MNQKMIIAFRTILRIFKFLFIGYLLFIFNVFFIGLVYIKVAKVSTTTKIAFPFGTLSLLLVALEFFIYYRFIKNRREKK